jgi:hypothetical protein
VVVGLADSPKVGCTVKLKHFAAASLCPLARGAHLTKTDRGAVSGGTSPIADGTMA